MPGRHNLYNAHAVMCAARRLGVPESKAKKYLKEFTGTERRLQFLGRYRGAVIIDDYAHHPTEIKASLAAMRQKYQTKKIITVFHPHTFTRTKAFFKDFTRSFAATDELIILDIYGSARESANWRKGGVSSRQLADEIIEFNRAHKIKQSVKPIATIPQATAYLRRRLKTGEVLLLMGAGDVFRVGERLLPSK